MGSISDKILNQDTARALALYFSPRVLDLPLPIQRFDDPFLPFGKAVINASREFVGVYILDVPAYLAIGGAGAVALERTIDYLNDEVPCILHGPFGSAAFAGILDKLAFGADAITVIAGEVERLALVDLAKQEIGQWDTVRNELVIHVQSAQSQVMRVVGDEVIYKHRQDDFADVIRSTLAGL